MKWILLLIYIALIVAVIFLERKSPTEAVLWVLIMIFLPYFGVFLYLVFGSTMSIKLTSYFRKKRLKDRYELPKSKSSDDEASVCYPLSEEDRQVMQFNYTYNDSEITCYKDAEFFITGESHYKRLFGDIREAKECIYIEFYTIHHDTMGEALAKILTEKAKEGVKVIVLCDFIANISTPKKMYENLLNAGGTVIRVKPFLTHYRSHRKIVVIDHKVSYIGGMNIGVQYANMAEKKNPWRDTQIRLTGPCCNILDGYFLTDYLCAVKRRDWENALEYVDSIEDAPNYMNRNMCQFIVGGVDTSKESVKMCYLSMIRSAKKRIRIQTPYFVPDASILDALKAASAAGVEIEVMIPGIKANFFLDPVTTYYCGQLMEFGAKVYKYNGYIHAKTMVIDDEICCVGSVNMDMRSLMVDDEVCGVLYENSIVEKYNKIYDEDILNTKEYLYSEFKNRSIKDKFSEGFFLLFAPLM